MPFNGSGTFVPIAAPNYPAVAGQPVYASQFNANMVDLFAGFNNCVTRDGQSPATANLPMGGFKLAGLGVATFLGDALSYGQAGNLTSLVMAGTLSGVTNLTTTGNTILGDATTDTINIASGGLTRNSNGLGINTTVTVPLALRVQAEGSNDAGLDMVRISATNWQTIGYNRSGASYITLSYDASDYTWGTSGTQRWVLNSGGSLTPLVTNTYNIGSSLLRPASLFGVLGDFSGLLTASVGISLGNASSTGTTLGYVSQLVSFTPGITFSGAAVSVTYSTQTGRYTRIGNVVMFSLLMVLTSKGSSVGTVAITGLPFAANASISSPVTVVMNNMLTNPTTVTGFVTFSATTIQLNSNTNNAGGTALTNVDIANTTSVQISGCYMTA